MNVGELKAKLADIDDDAEILFYHTDGEWGDRIESFDGDLVSCNDSCSCFGVRNRYDWYCVGDESERVKHVLFK